jgi:hypothetical protein
MRFAFSPDYSDLQMIVVSKCDYKFGVKKVGKRKVKN